MAINVAQMDKVSGLSKDKFSAMDKIVEASQQIPQTPEDKITGIPKDILNVTQGIGGTAKSLGFGLPVDLLAHYGAGKVAQDTTGVNPLLNSQTLQQEQAQPIQNAVGDVGSAALDLGGGELLGLGGKGIKAASKYGTLNKLNKEYEAAHKASAASGLTKNWSDIVTQVNKTMQEGANRFSPDLQKEVQTVLAKRSPAQTVEGATKKAGVLEDTLKKDVAFGSKDLHDLRKAFDQSIPKTAWGQNVNIRPVGVAANQVVRKAVSDAMHEIAPETKTLDKWYSTFSHDFFQKGPHIPFTKVDIPMPKSMKGLPTGVVNAALDTIIGTEIAKHLGL